MGCGFGSNISNPLACLFQVSKGNEEEEVGMHECGEVPSSIELCKQDNGSPRISGSDPTARPKSFLLHPLPLTAAHIRKKIETE